MFNWDLVWFYLFRDPNLYFLRATWLVIWVSVTAQVLGVILGLFLALMQMSRWPVLKWIARAYLWFFRGSPLLVQVLLLWTGLPKVIPGLLLPDYACVLVAFSLNEGAYMSEIIRAAIGSVDPGQMEASKALGMRYWVAMRRIILPQAARVVIPPLGNEFNNMLKTTSLATVIGMLDLTGTARQIGSPTFSIFEMLIVATVYYLLLTTIWDVIQRWIEKRLDPDRNQKVKLNKNFTQRVFGFGSNRGNQLVSGGM